MRTDQLQLLDRELLILSDAGHILERSYQNCQKIS